MMWILFLSMAQHNNTGKAGEQLAISWFTERSYIILHKNWRHRHWEVDLIASKENVLHFIEVKTRTSLAFGYPEDSVSHKKIAYLIDAADEYLQLYPKWKRIQFDVLAVTMLKNEVEYFLIEDVYL